MLKISARSAAIVGLLLCAGSFQPVRFSHSQMTCYFVEWLQLRQVMYRAMSALRFSFDTQLLDAISDVRHGVDHVSSRDNWIVGVGVVGVGVVVGP